MDNFAVYYIEANVVCIIIFAILLFYNHFNIDRQEKQVKFDHVLISFILYFLTDSFWAAIVTEIIPKTRFTVVLNLFLIYVLMSLITYSWLQYVMAVEQAPHRERKINQFAVIFPFLVSTIVLIINYIAAPQMLVSETLESLGAFNIYLVAVPYVYMAAILCYTMGQAIHAEDPMERVKHLFIGLFPLMIVAGGIVEMAYCPEIPIFCFTCLILMLLFYIQSIELRVSLDPLTNLNNRGQLVCYTSQKSNLYQTGKQTVVIMIDINDFKMINDTYGHSEGDKALVIVADSLKTVINRYNMPSFLGRYGGDEFILIIHPVDIEVTEQLIQEIRAEIVERCRISEKPYSLTIGAGYDRLTGLVDNIQDCIMRSDQKLYRDKKNIKRVNAHAA